MADASSIAYSHNCCDVGAACRDGRKPEQTCENEERATWHLDLDLCAQTGLDYVVTEFLPNDEGSFWLSAEGDVLVREAFDFASSAIRPLDEWITANAEALQSVVADMAAHTRGIFPGLN